MLCNVSLTNYTTQLFAKTRLKQSFNFIGVNHKSDGVTLFIKNRCQVKNGFTNFLTNINSIKAVLILMV